MKTGSTRDGQKGHKKNTRKPFTEDQITGTPEYYLESCPECGNKLEAMDESQTKKIVAVHGVEINAPPREYK